MVSGSGRGISSRLKPTLIGLGLLLASCSATASLDEATTPPPATTTTSVAPTTPTTVPPTTTTAVTTSTVVLGLEIDAEVKIPAGIGPFPAVVLVHGGSWVAGSPSIMRPLAEHLTASGFLTVNPRYQLSNERPGYPQAFEDVACAVRYASAHPDSDGSVAIVGHSAGAHIAAVVALTGDAHFENCPFPGSGVPDKLIGLAGPYDVIRLGPLMIPFFGVGPEEDPDAWFFGNPLNLVDQNTELTSLLLHGDEDGLVEYSFTSDFDQALRSGGSESLIEIVEGARHMDMHDPEVVGDLIVAWLGR